MTSRRTGNQGWGTVLPRQGQRRQRPEGGSASLGTDGGGWELPGRREEDCAVVGMRSSRRRGHLHTGDCRPADGGTPAVRTLREIAIPTTPYPRAPFCLVGCWWAGFFYLTKPSCFCFVVYIWKEKIYYTYLIYCTSDSKIGHFAFIKSQNYSNYLSVLVWSGFEDGSFFIKKYGKKMFWEFLFFITFAFF